jgi:hypothetical protein
MVCALTSTVACGRSPPSGRGCQSRPYRSTLPTACPSGAFCPASTSEFTGFAVTQKDLFRTMEPIVGAPQAIRRLGTEGVRIRIITHRLFIRYFHEAAVAQTVAWLDAHGIPYWDLCFMRDKELVDAHVYVEDTDKNIRRLEAGHCKVVAFTNSTNVDMDPPPALRADSWGDAENLIREAYTVWLDERGQAKPPAPGYRIDPLARAVADGVVTDAQADGLRQYLA